MFLVKKANVGQKASSYVGPSLWNNLNQTLKTSNNLNALKDNIKPLSASFALL